MYSIGEFSRMNRITPRTLRHYDSLGLLSPARIDSWTGYRYYDASQLPRMQQILTLRDLGFSLDEIGMVLQDESRLPALMKDREARLVRSIREEKARLNRLRQFIDEGVKTMNTVVIRKLPEVIVASMRVTVDSYDSYFDVVPKMGEYMNSVGAVCAEPAYCFNLYHDGEYRERDIDVEICEAVTAFSPDSDKVKFKTIPGVDEAACLMHKGPYSSLSESYNALFRWIEEQGWQADGLPRESYIDGIWNKEDPAEWLTEIQIPVIRK
ncbi:MAG: MerR family transcriptional regulator [Spirochaetales bacterium]|nr:MerR family transcriptional regulator [Spirochaetales bacterium]